MGEMASQCSELDKAYTFKLREECTFRLKRVKAVTHHGPCSYPCQGGLCDRAHSKAHFTASTARCLCAPLPWTAHNLKALVFSSSWLCLLDHFIKPHSVKLQEQNFTQTSGSYFSEPTVSKGQVKVVWEKEMLGYTPTLQDYTCISHKGPEVKAIFTLLQRLVRLSPNPTFSHPPAQNLSPERTSMAFIAAFSSGQSTNA